MSAARALAALLVLALLAGCAGLPSTGPVQTREAQQPVDQDAGFFDYTPAGPRPGSSALRIVEDFLLAMQAAPPSTAVARKFLTEEARAGWFPDKTTLVYGSKLVTGRSGDVQVRLQDAVQLDDRGRWLGRVGGARGVRYDLELVREAGEWRITDPPDALLLPRSHFETRYQQLFVYFFDPTGRVLVPEPTYVPRGEQAATLLVRRLLRGPDRTLDGVLRTYLPHGTEYVLSVPVSETGVADLELSEELLQLSEPDRQLALAQLAWTLRQVSGLDSMRVSVNGSPIEIPGSGSPQSVWSWAGLDPAVDWASRELYGLRDGDVVALAPDSGEVLGRFGGREFALRDIAVDLAGERVAGVTEDGSTVVVAPRLGDPGDPPRPRTTVVRSGARDVLQPSWDALGTLWTVDRTASGPVVHALVEGQVTAVETPGLEGEELAGFTVSRDGSRFVAVVRERTGDRLAIARVVRGAEGRVRRLTTAVRLPLGQHGVDEIRDLGWRSPAGLAVLSGPTPESSQLLVTLVDGSTSLAGIDTTAAILRRRAERVAAAPDAGNPVYLGEPGGVLHELTTDGQWSRASEVEPLLVPTYVG